MTHALRARADIEGESPFKIVSHVYSTEFLGKLGNDFGFDTAENEYVTELRDMGARYILHRRLESSPNIREEYLPVYRGIQKISTKYLDALRGYDFSEIELDMQIAATSIPDVSGRQISNDEISKCFSRPYYRELIWLLELLKASTERPIRDLTPSPGPKINEGLEAFVGKIADFWIQRLNREFIILHKKRDTPRKRGLPTPAFEFVKALVVPIDDISDTTIKTVMRKEIASRRKLINLGRT